MRTNLFMNLGQRLIDRGHAIGVGFLVGFSCLTLGISAPKEALSAGPAAEAVSDASEHAPPKRMRMISSEQYLNTLNYLFGPDLLVDPSLPPLHRTDGLLSNGGAVAGVTNAQLEQYQRTAAAVATKAVSMDRRDILIPCKPASETGPDAKCAAKFIGQTGRFLYRRTLTRADVRHWVDAANDGAERLKDFYAGLSIALEGMLLDPEVLYIAEVSEPDPKHPGHERLTAYSLASRLSFFLWNAGPDDELLKAAENGALYTDKGLRKAVDRMLASPRLRVGMRAFFDDMLRLDDFNTLAKDATVYPQFNGVTAADAREQTLRTVIDHLVVRSQDYRDLFTTRRTFISPSLAGLYGIPSASQDWQAYEFPADSPRSGFVTQISFLAGHSHPARSSPTLRGKALREILLCQTVPRPPANVDFSVVENPKSGLRTARERVTLHLKNPVCAGCHKITDPMGLALENFDGAGAYRDSERGVEIDAHGNLDGVEFKDVEGLAQALRNHPALPTCLVRRLYAYGTGGPLAGGNNPLLDTLNARFAKDGYRVPDLLREIVLAPSFSEVYRRPAKPDAPAKS